MPTIRLAPNGDGTLDVSGWTDFSGLTINLFAGVDDYVSGGAHNSDTDGILGPNKVTDKSFFALLQDTAADFNPANLTTVELRRAARMESAGVSAGVDSISLGWQIFRADEVTPITTEIVTGPLGTTYTESTFALTPTGTHTKADWDGARLRIRQVYAASGMADTTARARVTAVEAILNYSLPPKMTSVARISLAGGAVPETRTNHKLKIVARKTNAAHTATVRTRLFEGATARSAEYETPNLTTTLTEYVLPLTDVEAASITSYADLEARLQGYASQGDSAVVEVSELSFESPQGSVTVVARNLIRMVV